MEDNQATSASSLIHLKTSAHQSMDVIPNRQFSQDRICETLGAMVFALSDARSSCREIQCADCMMSRSVPRLQTTGSVNSVASSRRWPARLMTDGKRQCRTHDCDGKKVAALRIRTIRTNKDKTKKAQHGSAMTLVACPLWSQPAPNSH